METPKGEYKGECNRSACDNSNATFFNHSTLKHYCGECAYEINQWAQDFKDETGHELCVKVEPQNNGICESNPSTDTMSHEDFILKLKELGFNIEIKSVNDRDFSFHLELNGIRISGRDYPIFGMECGGAYNSCSRSKQIEFTQDDINKAVKKGVEIINYELNTFKYAPNYHSCRYYFASNPPKSKIEKESIDRVFKMIKDDYNAIIRFEKNRNP